jgi:DNA-binding NarL/FixJ family response regulator
MIAKNKSLWTLEEETQLRLMYKPYKSRKIIADALGRTMAAVSFKIQDLELSPQSKKNKIWKWSTREDEILMNIYKKYKSKEIAEILCRSEGSIKLRIHNLKKGK